MPGRIREDDVAEVRQRARIEDVIGDVVSLRTAGGGSLKGLCPFHDEKTPSFQVTPAKGFFYCFGCGEGGDVITFLMKHDNLAFAEAVEQLADRVGVQLRREDGPGQPHLEPGLRTRILEANAAAAEFFSRQLATPGALAGRQFLDQRGFDRPAAEHFSLGWAPRGGRELLQHLRGKGFSQPDLVRAGLVREAGWDFFQGRLLWPIRDASRQVVGFGARRIFDDDRMPAKYLNTPETPVYKKSHVLYGLDLARQQIGKKSQAVVVEGYTDVMAAHLSGVDTAVASCGTAFGEDHSRTLQRLMGGDAFTGEVVFTFDGDAAGQAAALKVFNFDQKFISQTYVAVEPTGLDPCDLRIQHGDAAVRELVARRVPLYRFVMGNVLERFDLDRADGRLGALRAAAPLVTSVRDSGLVSGYVRDLAGMLGMDIDEVRQEVARAARRRDSVRGGQPGGQPGAPAARQPGPLAGPPVGPGAADAEKVPAEQARPQRPSLPWPDAGERTLIVERDTAKLLVQHPQLMSAHVAALEPADFRHPAYAAVLGLCQRADEAHAEIPDPDAWAQRLRDLTDDPVLDRLVVVLAVERLPHAPDERYVSAYVAKLKLLTTDRRIADVKSRLQRTNPLDDQVAYNRMFSDLLALEQERRQLQARSLGLQA